MPAPWAAGAQVRIIGELHGSQTVNVLNFATNTVGWDDPNFLRDQLVLLVNAVIECVRDTLLPAVTSDWTLVRCEAHLLVPVVSDVVVVTGLPTDVGERGPTSVSFAATLVHNRSFFGSRRGRGRIFLPPPGEADITASDMDEAVLLLLAQFLLCLAGKFMEVDKTTIWNLGVLSRLDSGVNNANFDVGFRQSLSLNPSRTLAKIGSRKKGVGS